MKKLTASEIKILKDHFQSLTFPTNCELTYESQIPNTGIVLISGELALYHKKKLTQMLTPAWMLGLYDLINNKPSQHSYKVTGKSELMIISKSDILEVLSHENSSLRSLFLAALNTGS